MFSSISALVLRFLLSLIYIFFGCLFFVLGGIYSVGFTEGAGFGIGILLAGLVVVTGVLSCKATLKSLNSNPRTFLPQAPLSALYILACSLLVLVSSVLSVKNLIEIPAISSSDLLIQNSLMIVASLAAVFVFGTDSVIGSVKYYKELVGAVQETNKEDPKSNI